jgi:polyhydroxyalkanoate synthesis regulator phasin
MQGKKAAIGMAAAFGGLALGLTVPAVAAGGSDDDGSDGSSGAERGAFVIDAPFSGPLFIGGPGGGLGPGPIGGPFGGEHAAPGEIVDEALAGLVDDGTLTQDQADAVKDALERAFDEAMPDGPLEVAAETIGIDVETLIEGLRDGDTIADIAEANGSSADAVIDALVAQQRERLDQAVEDGHLRQEQADEIAAGLRERTEALVNGDLGAMHESDSGSDAEEPEVDVA